MTAPPLACPVCGRPVTGPPPAPCPGCGLPAVGSSALVVARIGATLAELARDREALLSTLRAAAPGAWTAPPPPAMPPAAMPPAPIPPVPVLVPVPRRRLSPQQVLLGLGALLLVSGAVAFVAVAWTRLGLLFQASVLVAVTGAACAASAVAGRRGLRATEEALAATGAALLGVDLGAAWAEDLFGVGDLPLRWWAAAACLGAAVLLTGLSRLTRSTATWPLAALLAVQPVPFLLLGPDRVAAPAGVAAALALAAADRVTATRLRRGLAPVAAVLSGLWALTGVATGLAVAGTTGPLRAWTAAAVLAAGGAVGLVLPRLPRRGVAPVAAGVVGLAAGLAARTPLPAGPVAVAAAGLVLLGAAVLLARRVPAVALLAAGCTAALTGTAQLLHAGRPAPVAALLVAAALPAALAAVRLPRVRPVTGAAVPVTLAAAALTARSAGVLPTGSTVLLLALVAACASAVAAARARRPEEPWLGGAAGVSTAAAVVLGTNTGLPGSVALALALSGVGALCHGLAARRRELTTAALGVLVVASWTAAGAAHLTTPEAYTLPAAAGLLLAALPQLRRGGPSWAGEGAAVAVALVPSALLCATDPVVPRLAGVLVAAVALTVAGALLHRQAPFVLGAASLAFVVLSRLGPYAPLIPRWLLLTAGGLVLLAVGATYERRRQQAREAVAWVGQMR